MFGSIASPTPHAAGQLRNLERALGEAVRLCDRTALILDIFSQRAQTREGKLQVRGFAVAVLSFPPAAGAAAWFSGFE